MLCRLILIAYLGDLQKLKRIVAKKLLRLHNALSDGLCTLCLITKSVSSFLSILKLLSSIFVYTVGLYTLI